MKSATDNFNDEKNCIGVGGFGKVYKGELSHYKGRSIVAIKRLSSSGGQGTPEFLKEIITLSRCSHENLISLLGFCYEGEEMILVYEHASRGSLDHYLNYPHLTWSQRIKICLDAAKGLRYLHDPRKSHQRLIHCDVKSANILLDDQWNAKVSDLGLSIVGSANEQQSVVVTLAAGTLGYIDPQYMLTNTLTKESDVYSFGVVLFEVLCGKLCFTYSNGRTQKILVPTWIESYEQKKLFDIIFKNPNIQPLEESTFEILSDIAYRCLKKYRGDRPKMTEVVTELETALGGQEFSEGKQPFDYEEMAKSAEPPLNYRSKVELWKLLLKGVLLNGGKTWFSLNKKGEHCEMISFAECLISGPGEFKPAQNSRFSVGPYRLKRWGTVKARVKTQFLSLGIMYTMNFMFRKIERGFSKETIGLNYKLEGETETSDPDLAYESDDGYCWMCELYQFTSDRRDHEILFEFEVGSDIEVVGIDFRPLEEVEHKDEKQVLSDPDANWQEKLPADYEDIIKLSKDIMPWTTKKEAYSIIRKGFLINDGQEWFSLDDNGMKCYMLSARATFARTVDESETESPPESRSMLYSPKSRFFSETDSRFGEVLQCGVDRTAQISCEIKFQLLSYEPTYAIYIIYKLAKDHGCYGPIPVEDVPMRFLTRNEQPYQSFIHFVSPKTPVIRPKANQNTHNPLNRPKIKNLPRQRDDGWMEVQIWDFRTSTAYTSIPINLRFVAFTMGLIIQGFEVRPV